MKIDWKPMSDPERPDNDRTVLVFEEDLNHWRGRPWKQQHTAYFDDQWQVGEEIYEADGSPFDGKNGGARLTHWAELPDNPDGSRGNPNYPSEYTPPPATP